MKQLLITIQLLIAILLIGCGSGDSNSEADTGSSGSDAEDTDTSDIGDTGEDTTPDPNAWLIGFDAPDTWGAATDCGTVGDSCVNFSGCSGDAMCQTEGWVCIPNMMEEGRSKGEEYPYCMSYVCMTYEEASCYCAGVGADVSSAACTGGPKAILGLCSPEGYSCMDKECCGDTTCVKVNSATKVCEHTCKTADDCESGCCTDLHGTGTLVCADMSECENPCTPIAGACASGNDCCQGTCVTSDAPEFAGCRLTCKEDKDCSSGCCIPFTDGDSGFCADASLCGCLNEGEACFNSVIPCCDGFKCMGFPPDELSYVCTPG